MYDPYIATLKSTKVLCNMYLIENVVISLRLTATETYTSFTASFSSSSSVSSSDINIPSSYFTAASVFRKAGHTYHSDYGTATPIPRPSCHIFFRFPSIFQNLTLQPAPLHFYAVFMCDIKRLINLWKYLTILCVITVVT